MRQLGFLLLFIISGLAPLSADHHVQGAGQAEKKAAKDWLSANMAFLSCDESHYIYGVGYIDGSYMERVFYVRDSGNKPRISVRFRDTAKPDPAANDAAVTLRFVLEIHVPEALYASPAGDGWRVSEEGWESALRFKYTSWYGIMTRQDSHWQIEWQGYRRPMLPAGSEAQVNELCSLFAGR